MQTITTAIFLLSLLTAHPVFVQSQVSINSLFANTQSGQGTYYGATTGGNCGYGTLIPSFVSSLTQVALNSLDYVGSDMSEGCGMCIQMQGTGGGSGSNPISTTPFIAFVQDKCPSCVPGGIDIALSGDGAWDISWIAVPCPVGSYTIQYQLQGSNNYYLKLQVIGSSIPVTAVTLVIGGANYATSRTDDNFWNPVSAPTPFVFPLTILLTAYDGSVLQDTVPSLTNNILLSGSGVQFKTTKAPTAAPTKAPTAAPTAAPTKAPTAAPTAAPTKAPTAAPTTAPTAAPTKAPTAAPTAPTKAPTAAPTAPTKAPTAAPTAPTKAPTAAPTAAPTKAPTAAPTKAPTASTLTCQNGNSSPYNLEFFPPTGSTPSSSTPASISCSGGITVSCIWSSSLAKFQCASPNVACLNPVPTYNGQSCPYPSSPSCGDSGCTINEYWVEYTPPTNAVSPPTTSYVTCANGQVYSCNWTFNVKYQCAPSTACDSPLPIYNGVPCSIPNTLEVVIDTAQPSGAMSLPSATVAGIVIGCVGVIVVLVVVVVVIKRKPLTVEEHV